MRRASSAVASSPRPASSAAISASRRTKRSTALPTDSAGRRASIRAMASPVTATTGVLEAYTPRLRTRPATVPPLARASECSSLKSASTVSSQSDRRTRRTSMPTRSPIAAARRRSKARITTTRVPAWPGTSAVAPSAPSGSDGSATRKRSPCSPTGSASSSQRKRPGAAANTPSSATTAQTSRPPVSQNRRTKNSSGSGWPARSSRCNVGRLASSLAEVSASSL